MKQLSSIVVIAVLLIAASMVINQRSQGNDAAVASPDRGISDKLRTIVGIRQKLAESNERAIHSGKGETDGRYELALAEARLRLARELGQRMEQVGALKDIVKVHQR